jgi:hypothetical protein
MAVVLLYHDVVEPGQYAASGFHGPGADRYKLTREEFADHLNAISRAAPQSLPILTFDDGGASSLHIADELERKGWRGLFFITTDHIGKPGFVDTLQIHELRSRGHCIGTHSCSHPPRMSSSDFQSLVLEWRKSSSVLTEILGEPVTVASVPGGYYSRAVAQAAADAGLLVLYTSEPTMRVRSVAGCTVVGRYSVYAGMSALAAASIAEGRPSPRLAQALLWNAKKVAKVLVGTHYDAIRDQILTWSRHSDRG